MRSPDDFKVLDAIANSPQGRIYAVGGQGYAEEVYGITWQTLQEITGLSTDDLKRSVKELLREGLIGQGGPVSSPTRRLLGRRRPLYLWATPDGRRALLKAVREAS